MSRQHHILHVHLSKKKRKSILDKIVMVAAFLYPLSGLPQVLMVFNGSVDGVSLPSWVGFMLFSMLFLIYGTMHKIKPMIVTNAVWLLVDSLVVIGTVAHRITV